MATRVSLRTGPASRARADTILSVGTGLAGQASVVVTGIIAARALGVEDRGHFAFIFLVSLAFAQLGSLGVPIAMTYFIASDPGETRRLAAKLRRFAVIQVAVVTVVHAIVLVALFVSSRSDIQVAAAISLPTSGAQVAQQYALGVLQGLRRFRSFNVLRLIGPIGYAVAAAAAWILGYRSLIDMTITFSGAYVLAGVLTAIVVLRLELPPDGASRESHPALGEIVRFGMKGLLGAASPMETFRIDQSIVGLFLSPVSLGLYVSAVSFTNLPKFIAQSVGMVAYPYVARHPDEATRRRTMWRFAVMSSIVCAAVVVVMELVLSRLIPLLFGNAFSAATPVARVLLIAGFLISVRRILSDGARGIGKPGVGTIAEVTSWVLLVPSLLVCVHFGLQAVAWGLTVGAAVAVAVLLALLLGRPRLGRQATYDAARDPAGAVEEVVMASEI